MKKIRLLLFVILGMVMAVSCKKDTAPQQNTDPDNTVEKQNVKTYEFVNLFFHEELANRYQGTIGTAAVELIKTSDTTLSFFVPDIAAGDAVLKFDLATITFNVAKTVAVDTDEFLEDLTERFAAQMASLTSFTPEEAAEIDRLNEYKEEVVTLFNSLSPEEKRQTVLFYEANKDIVKSLSEQASSKSINSPGIHKVAQVGGLSSQTFYEFGDCTANESFRLVQGCRAEKLADRSKDITIAALKIVTLYLTADVLLGTAPLTFGWSAVGATLAAGTAGYLFVVEFLPPATHYKRAVTSFLGEKWILTKDLFDTVNKEFPNDIIAGLNLKPKFRSLTSEDGAIHTGCAYFIHRVDVLKGYWDKLSAVLGGFPSYKNMAEPTDLATGEITISNISNPNVQYLGHEGQSVKFKSLSGKEESFTYNIRISKEGFVEEKELDGKVMVEEYNYVLQIGDYHPDYDLITSQKTVSPGGSLTLPNNMVQMVRLLLDGEPVKVGEFGHAWAQVPFGTTPVSGASIHHPEYTFTVYDHTNSVSVL